MTPELESTGHERARSRVDRPRLSHAPLFSREVIHRDVFSGLTVALVGLPQCLAYAMMSGLPPAYGLATAAVPGLIAALIGRSAQVVTGPTNTTGLLILAALGPWLGESGLLTAEGLPVLATLTVMAGLIRVIGSYVGAVELLRFLPGSVLVGFTAGAGILIALMQLDEALGIPPIRGGGMLDELRGVWSAIAGGHRPAIGAVLTTLLTAAALILGKRFAPRWPTALLAVLAAIAVVWAFNLDAAHGLPLVADRSVIPIGWPPGAMPSLDLGLITSLITPAFAIVFLGTLELTVTTHAGAERPDMKRELQAQGWANVVGAFTSAFPASASLTRSALLKLGGGRTRLAAVSAALTVIPILLFGGGFVGLIPQASLAGILFVTAYGMVDRARMARMWLANRETQVLMFATLIATLTMPLEWAIVVGAGLGLTIHLAKTAAPRIVALVLDGSTLRPIAEGETPEVVVLEVSGDVHYAAVSAFSKDVRAKLPASAKRVVIDLSHAHEMRYEALSALENLAAELHDRGATLELVGVSTAFARLLDLSESELLFTEFEPTPGRSLHRVLEQPLRPASS